MAEWRMSKMVAGQWDKKMAVWWLGFNGSMAGKEGVRWYGKEGGVKMAVWQGRRG